VDASHLRRSESSLEGSGGLCLFRRAWLPPQPRRVMLLIHGFAEHSGRYEAPGAWFAARGCAVHAYDQRGHGRSDGMRGHVERFDEFLDDATILLDAVKAEHPGLPVVLVGHSMGGLILASFLRERRPAVAAAVSSCAAFQLDDALSAWRLRLARLTRRVAPRASIAANLPLAGLSRDPEVIRQYEEDPLVFHKLTVSLALEMFDAARRLHGGAADVKVPLLVLHGEDDPIAPPQGSRGFSAGLVSPGSDLRIYPGLRHEIFNEPEAESVYADVVTWLDKLGVS
jgi:alpha-beta hydrolase superfamily lysophospholipase